VRRVLLGLAIGALSFASRADAQPMFADSSRYALSLSYGVFDYDLSGVGDVRMLAARLERPFTKYVIAEAGMLYARPLVQSGKKTHFLVPEFQVQAQLPLPLISPYIGLGGGVAVDLGRDQDPVTSPPQPAQRRRRRSDPTASISGGLRTWFNRAVGARAELRVRGIGGEFHGSSSEWTMGVTITL
jgi:hypothetical protein